MYKLAYICFDFFNFVNDYVVQVMLFLPDQARAMTLPPTMASSLENVEAARDWYHDQPLLQSSRQMGDLEGKWEEKCDNKGEGDDNEEEKTA